MKVVCQILYLEQCQHQQSLQDFCMWETKTRKENETMFKINTRADHSEGAKD